MRFGGMVDEFGKTESGEREFEVVLRKNVIGCMLSHRRKLVRASFRNFQ